MGAKAKAMKAKVRAMKAKVRAARRRRAARGRPFSIFSSFPARRRRAARRRPSTSTASVATPFTFKTRYIAIRISSNHGHPRYVSMWGPIKVKSRPSQTCADEVDRNFKPGDKMVNCNAGGKNQVQEYGFKFSVRGDVLIQMVKKLFTSMFKPPVDAALQAVPNELQKIRKKIGLMEEMEMRFEAEQRAREEELARYWSELSKERYQEELTKRDKVETQKFIAQE